jgi:hypothetical protein
VPLKPSAASRVSAQRVAAMLPATKSGLNARTCISALQKAIRRGLEKEAMQFAVELMHTSKAFHTMLCTG